MNESKRNELEDAAISRLVAFGVSKIPRLNDITLEIDELRELRDEELAVAIICYGASLARLTKLNLSSLLRITTGAYLSVEITPKEAAPSTATEPEEQNG